MLSEAKYLTTDSATDYVHGELSTQSRKPQWRFQHT